MAYTLNSAKDSRGDEDQFVQRFNQHLMAIDAYKRAHGGDLEGAYQAVTGQPWPAGRSVKIKDGRGFMTKDRTVKSVLGKYVALPAAYAGLTLATGGAASPMLLGLAGGGAASGAGAGAVAAGAGAAGGAGVAGAAGAGTIGSLMATAAVPMGINAAANIYGNRTQGNAAREAGEIEAAAAAEVLKFTREQEETRKREYAAAEAKNYGLFREREARLQPYRQIGTGTIGQLMQAPHGVGSLGALMGRR